MAARALQLYGLSPAGAKARPRDPRHTKDLEFEDRALRHAVCQAPGRAALRRYHDIVFERFWKRELDIEDSDVIGAVLAQAGADSAGFPAYLAEAGRRELDDISRAAEAIGVFGVPSFVLDGELFWGREHLPDIREMLSSIR